jgi:hypothetical protein
MSRQRREATRLHYQRQRVAEAYAWQRWDRRHRMHERWHQWAPPSSGYLWLPYPQRDVVPSAHFARYHATSPFFSGARSA